MGLFEFGNEPVIDGFSVKSNDELAELIIPKGALPGNVDQNDISVTRISSTSSEDESWIIYELEPDGLEFTEEILLKVQLDIDNDAIPIVFISTNTGIDLVNNTKSEVDLEIGKQNVTIPLTHFSNVCISSDHDPYEIKVSARDTPCGKQIITNASFTLYKDNFIAAYYSGGVSVWEFLEPSVKIKGSWENFDLGISPIRKIHGKPPYTDVSVGQTVTFQDDTFKCINPGEKGLYYKLEIHVKEMKHTFYRSDEDYLAGIVTTLETIKYFHQTRYLFAPFKCISEDVEDDPRTDPGVDPKVELSFNWTYNSQGLNVNTKIFIDIEAYPGSTGTVTLSGPDTQPMTLPVTIDQSGQTRITFIVYHFGNYTAVVKMNGYTIEKSIFA